MVQIVPSILAADFGRLADEIGRVERAGAGMIHVDIMDGHFVPNLTIGPMIVEAVKRATDKPLDVHLMIERVDLFIPIFADAGADIITIHQEATRHLHIDIQQIRKRNIKAGVAINPGTAVSTITPVLGDVDLVLVMTVNPGFGGQKFIHSTMDKVGELVRLRRERGLNFIIEVDGGISGSTVELAAQSGRGGAAG